MGWRRMGCCMAVHEGVHPHHPTSRVVGTTARHASFQAPPRGPDRLKASHLASCLWSARVASHKPLQVGRHPPDPTMGRAEVGAMDVKQGRMAGQNACATPRVTWPCLLLTWNFAKAARRS